MINLQLDEHTKENMEAIQELRELGMSDEEIQKLVDRQNEIDMRGKTDD